MPREMSLMSTTLLVFTSKHRLRGACQVDRRENDGVRRQDSEGLPSSAQQSRGQLSLQRSGRQACARPAPGPLQRHCLDPDLRMDVAFVAAGLPLEHLTHGCSETQGDSSAQAAVLKALLDR